CGVARSSVDLHGALPDDGRRRIGDPDLGRGLPAGTLAPSLRAAWCRWPPAPVRADRLGLRRPCEWKAAAGAAGDGRRLPPRRERTAGARRLACPAATAAPRARDAPGPRVRDRFARPCEQRSLPR